MKSIGGRRLNERDLMQRITEYAAAEAAENIRDDIGFVAANQLAECESPIERVLLLALFAECGATRRFPSILPGAIVGKKDHRGVRKARAVGQRLVHNCLPGSD